MAIVSSEYHEVPGTIHLETSKKTKINNEQYSRITLFDMEIIQRHEYEFSSKFQGEPSPTYNCHDLTFASKRTGIYDDEEILKIIRDEYQEVINEREVIIGDVIIYYDNNDKILHSGVVVKANNNNPHELVDIRILSKVRNYKEIVHNVNSSPYEGVRRFYRIKHDYHVIR